MTSRGQRGRNISGPELQVEKHGTFGTSTLMVDKWSKLDKNGTLLHSRSTTGWSIPEMFERDFAYLFDVASYLPDLIIQSANHSSRCRMVLGFKLGFKMHVFLSRRPQGSSFPRSRKSNKTTHRVMTCITAACMHVIDQLLKVKADQERNKKRLRHCPTSSSLQQ